MKKRLQKRKAVVTMLTAIERKKLASLTAVLNSATNSNTLRMLAMGRYDEALKLGVVTEITE